MSAKSEADLDAVEARALDLLKKLMRDNPTASPAQIAQMVCDIVASDRDAQFIRDGAVWHYLKNEMKP